MSVNRSSRALGGDRLAKFVNAKPRRFDHAPPFGMRRQHDDRDVRHWEYARRAHDAHELGPVQHRQVPVEDHHVGCQRTDHVEPGDAIARFIDHADADIHQEVAGDLAHVLVVVDDQYAQALNYRVEMTFRLYLQHAIQLGMRDFPLLFSARTPFPLSKGNRSTWRDHGRYSGGAPNARLLDGGKQSLAC